MQKSRNHFIVLNSLPERFEPLSQTRPVWDLLCGMKKGCERIHDLVAKLYPEAKISFMVQHEQLLLYQSIYQEYHIISDCEELATIFLHPFLSSLSFIDVQAVNQLYLSDGLCAAAVVDQGSVSDFLENNYKNFMQQEVAGVSLPHYLWDLVTGNGDSIRSDFNNYALVNQDANHSHNYKFALCGDIDQVYIEQSVTIDPFVVIDSRNGPVYISNDVHIHSFSRIEGPAYIAPGVTLLGAKMREGCSIGEGCRIGGEVEDSIFYAFSNKYHDGFIGHAYIGEWVNLGALATNSDLKNDYTNVSVYMGGVMVDTQSTKVGSFIGDHSKISIGSLMNTGTHIAPFSMSVHSGRMTPVYIPAFALFIKNLLRPIKSVDTLLTSIKKVMSRRNKTCSQEYEHYIRNYYTRSLKKTKNEIDRWNTGLK